mgnify:CR=1 FL=1
MSVFPERLRQAMLLRGLKASELADLSGIDKSAISNYLNAKYNPKQDKIYLLATALNVNPGWLIGLDDDMGYNPPSSNSDDRKLTKDEQELLDAYRILNDAGKENLRIIVDSLIRNPNLIRQKQERLA